MIVKMEKKELAGKTIEWAGVVERPTGDAEFLMRFTDGSVSTVVAWAKAGYSLQMGVDLSPNTNPQTDSGERTTREI
jgi:hypothetical protein